MRNQTLARAGIGVLVICMAMATTTFGSAAASATITQLSSDPYTNATSQHDTQVEPDSFAHGTIQVAAFQSGRFFDAGSSNIGWATMVSGVEVHQGFLPGTTKFATPAGPYNRASDPSVAYDAAHNTWLISYLGLYTSGHVRNDVAVSRSTDGGQTWNTPTVAALGPKDSYFDKSWITCDDHSASPYYGHCYAEFDEGEFYMVTSTDGGLTWSKRKSVMGKRFPAAGINGQPVVQPSGVVVVPFLSGDVYAFSSRDGGKSWGNVQRVAPIRLSVPKTNIRGLETPMSAAVGSNGKVFVVFMSCKAEAKCASDDLYLTTLSHNVWSKPALIPVDPIGSGVEHLLPAIAADPAVPGRIAVTYYLFPHWPCFTFTCRMEAATVSSANGGKTWDAPETLGSPMKLPWLADTDQGFMVGDYISNDIIGSTIYPVFASATKPTGGHLNEAIYSASVPAAWGS